MELASGNVEQNQGLKNMFTANSKRTYHIQSRKEAEELVIDDPHILVSIFTPRTVYENQPLICCATKNVFYLEIHDLDKVPGPGFREIYGEPKLFTEQDANDLASFLIVNLQPNVGLRVHCDAGISRSSAVALAWAKFEQDQTVVDKIHNDLHLSPNRWVYYGLSESLVNQ